MAACFKKRKNRQQHEGQGFVFEALEPRVLLSADPIGAAAELALDTERLLEEGSHAADFDDFAALLRGDAAAGSVPPALADTSPLPFDLDALIGAPAPDSDASREIVFVDRGIDDYETLIADLRDGDTDFTVVLLEHGRDGIAQISEALDGAIAYDAVHIVSHGTDAGFQLGGTWVNANTLAGYQDQIAGWGEAIAFDGDLLLYGCNLAASQDGRGLMNTIALLTGADVAASDDLTGSAGLGGDWDLEYQAGRIEAAVLAANGADWQGLLGASPAGGEIPVNENPLAWAQSTFNATPNAVAADAAGNFIVVWESDGQDGANEGIYARQFAADGTPLDNEFLVNNTVTDGAQTAPAVAMNADGAYVIVWQTDAYTDPAADKFDIYARLVDKDGNDSGEFRVNTGYTTEDQTDPAVTVREDGSFVVSWTSKNQDGDRDGVFAQRFDAAGAELGSQIQVNNITPEDQRYSSIDSNAAGEFAVTWTSKDLTQNKLTIFARLFNADGTPQDKQFLVDQFDTQDQQFSDIALLDDGSMVVVWASRNQDGGSDGIYARRFDPDRAPLGAEFLVHVSTPGIDETGPSVAADAAGNFVVTWTQGGTEVYAREFDALGNPVETADTHVTTGINDQAGASVAMTGNGSYVIVYSGEGSGDTDGVFAQRYAIPEPPAVDLNGAAAGADFSAAFVEDGGPVLIADPAATIDYVAGPDLSRLVLVLTNPLDGAAEILSADTSDPTIDPGITANYAGGILTIAGSGPVPVADLVTVLRTVTYENTSQAPSTPNRVIRVLAADGTELFGESSFTTVSVQALNDAPQITAPGSATTDEDTTLLFTAGGAGEVSISDDAGAETIEVSLDVTNGTISLTNRLDGEFRVNLDTPTDQQFPAVAVAEDGRYVVVWEQNNGVDKEDIYARTYAADGTAISGDILVNDNTNARQGSADVAIDDNGNFVVVWEHNTENANDKYDVNARTFDINGVAYDNAIRVNAEKLDDQLAPGVAMDPDGAFVVSWQSNTATSGREIYVRQFDLFMNDLSGGDILVNTTAASDQTAPDIAIKADGEFVVVWQSKDQDGDGEGIYLRRFDAAGDPLDPGEILVNAVTQADDQVAPSVAINDAGQAVIAWQSPDATGPNNWGIFAQRYDFDTAALVGGEIAVNTTTDNGQQAPAVAISANGNFVVAWQSADQDDDDDNKAGIFLQEFAADGSPLRFETQVNTFTVDDQTAPAIGMRGDSQYVVVWQSTDQDPGSTNGIYGQRFLQPGALDFTVGDGIDDTSMVLRGRLDNINAALTGLRFDPALDYYGPAELTISVDDLGNTGTGGAETASHTVAITVDPVNDDPLIQAPQGIQQVAETVPFVFDAFNGTLISLSDVDSDAGAPPELELIMSVLHGVLNVDVAGAGVAVTAGANDSAAMTIRGTQAQLNAALDGLVYTPDLLYLGADTLSLLVDDLGNFGSGGALTAATSVAINVFDFNVPPVNSLPAGVITGEDTPFVFAGANKLEVIDNDAAANDDIDVTLTVAHGLLSLTANPGITIIGDWAAGARTLTLDGDKSLVNDALDGIIYTPDLHFAGTDSLQMTTSDQGNSGIDGTKTDQDVITIQVTPDGTNDAPSIAAPASVNTSEETPYVFTSVAGEAIVVNDDANDQPVRVTLTAADGTVSLSTTVGSQFQANSNSADQQLNADAAMTPDGGYVLVWQSNNQDDDGYGIFGQRYAADGTVLGAEFKVNTVFAKHQTDPAVAVADDGSFVVVWVSEDQDGNNKGIFGQRYDAAGERVDASFQVNSYTNKAQTDPDIAMDASGRFVVVWTSDDQDGDDNGVYGQLFDAAGATVGNEFRVNLTTARDQQAAAVAMDADGDFVVVWQSEVAGDNKWDILARRFDAAGVAKDAGELAVNTISDQTQLAPDVAMDDAGNFVVVWQSRDLDYPDGEYGIYQRGFDADGTPQTAKQALVNSKVTRDQLAPVVAMDGDGDYVIAWQSEQQDDPDNKFGVYAQRYAADGSELGGEFRANTTTVKDQRAPAVAAGDDGRFIIAWESDGEDLSGYGIFGQLYKDVDSLTFIDGDGRDDATVIFEAGLDDVNNVLDGLVFTPAVDFDGVTTLTIEVDDLGNTGGAAQVTSAVTTINVSAVNDAPTFSLPIPQRAYEDVPLVFSAANGNAMVVQDADAGGDPVTVALTAYGGTLSLSTTAGLTFAVGDGSDDATLRFTGTLTDINNALDGLAFSAAPGFAGAGSIQIAADDGGNNGTGGAKTNAAAVVVNVESDFINDAPDISVPGPQQTGKDVPLRLSDADGNPIVIEDDALDTPIRVQLTAVNGTLTLADGVGPETQVNTATLNEQRFSAIAALPTGASIVVWQSNGQEAGGGEGIYAQRLNADGRSVGFEIHVNAFETGAQTAPVVAAAPSGEFAVAWISDGQDGSGLGVYARKFDANGNPISDELLVNTSVTGNQTAPAIAMDGDGGFVVVWEGPGDGDDLFFQRFDRNGVAVGAETPVNTTTIGNQELGAVAMDEAGNFVVVWQAPDANGLGIFAQRFDADGQVVGVTEFPVNTVEDGGNQELAAVAMNASGQFVIAWQGEDDNNSGIRASVYAADGTALSEDFIVNAFQDDNQIAPDVAVAADGSFVVTWQSADAAGEGIYARYFDALGNPVDGDMAVNLTTTADQTSPAVAVDGNGTAIVTWTSDNQDGDKEGVYQQQLIPAGAVTLHAGTGENDAFIDVEGTTAQINGLLNGLIFTPDAGFEGQARIDVAVDDQGNSGTGGALTAADSVFIGVNAPQLDLDADDSSGADGAAYHAYFTPGGAEIPVLDSDFVLTTPESELDSVLVTLTNAPDGASEWLEVDTSGYIEIDHSWTPGTGELYIFGRDVIANYELLLASVRYHNTAPAPDTTERLITVQFEDRQGDFSNIAETTVFIDQQPPVIMLSGELDYVEGDAAGLIVDAVTIADPDTDFFDGGRLTIDMATSGSVDDRLAIEGQAGGVGEITLSGLDISYNFGGATGTRVIGTLTQAGPYDGLTPIVIDLTADADAGAVEAVIRRLSYENVSDDPATNLRAVRFVLEDGEGGISETASATVRVEGVPSPIAAAVESFDYSAGGLAGATGGSGWSGAWQDGIGIDGDGQVFADNVSDASGTLYAEGSRAVLVEGVNDPVAYRHLADSLGTDGTEAWLGFVIRPDSPASFADGNYGGLVLGGGAEDGSGGLFIGHQSGNVGMETAGSGVGSFAGGLGAVEDQPLFMVANISFQPGEDVITLYVNPTPGSEPDGAFDPDRVVLKTDLDLGTFTQVALIGGTAAQQSFDEIRIGDSYLTVAPVTAPNVPPVVDTGQTLSVSEAAMVNDPVGTVTGSDPNPADTLQDWAIVSGNDDGVFQIDPASGAITVAATANLDYETTTSYTLGIEVSDGTLGSATETVTVSINPANDNDPVADDESFTVAEGGTATEADLDAGASLLDGDTDADLPNDTLTVNTTPVSGPSHGSLALNANGTFSYTHDGSENLADSFTYEVMDADGGVTDTGTVTITVTPVNDNDPVADDESFTVAEGGTATEADLDAGASLLDGDTDADLPNDTLTVNTTPVSGPSHGSLTLSANGTFSYTHDGSLNYTDSFTYEVLDADGGVTDTATVTITVTSLDLTLYLGTEADVINGGQDGVDDWTGADLVAIGDPNLDLGPGTTAGTFSLAFDLESLVPGLDLSGAHLVSHNLAFGSSGFQLLAGDLIFSAEGASTTLTSNNLTPLDSGFQAAVTIGDDDLAVFRPDYAGDYSSGAFALLIEDVSGIGEELRGVTLVESATTVGGTDLDAGDLLYAMKGASVDSTIYWYQTGTTGAGATPGGRPVLLNGEDAGVGNFTAQLRGLELLESAAIIGGEALSTGTILAAVNQVESVGDNGLAVDEYDVFALRVNASTENAGAGNGDADATVLFDGSQVQFDTIAEKLDALTLVPTGGAITGYYLDRFDTVGSFAGDDGSLSWSGDWQEVGEGNGAGSGDARVADNFLGDGGNVELVIRDGMAVYREADLSGAASATLSFDYARLNLDVGDDLVVYAQTGGTGATSIAGAPGTWDEIARIPGPANETSYSGAAVDLSAHIAADTRIMFLTEGVQVGNENIYVDNVRIDLAGTATAAPTPTPTPATFWLSTNGNVASPSGAPGLDSWQNGEILELGGADLELAPGTTDGDFSLIADLEALAVGGNIDLDGMHYVTQSLTLGTTHTIDLQPGDLLLSTRGAEAFEGGAFSVEDADIFRYRPTIAGDYSAGSFDYVLTDLELLADPDLNGMVDMWAFSLVEQDMPFGDTTLDAGDFLFSQEGSTDIYLFRTGDVGETTTAGTADVLISGAQVGISEDIDGMALIQTDTLLGDEVVAAGELLLTVDFGPDDDIGASTISADDEDIFRLQVTDTTLVAGTAVADAALLVDGFALGLETAAEDIDALTIVPGTTAPAGNAAPDLAGANDLTAITEDPVTNPGTLVSDLISGQISDADAGALEGIAVVAVDDSNGTWEYTTDGGGNWFAFGAVNSSNARLLAAEAGTLVRFVPDPDWNGTVVDGITFHAWDRTTGGNGDSVDLAGTETVRDEFNAVSYSNNDGTQNWNGAWTETWDDGDPGAGQVQITSGQLRIENQDGGNLESATRAVDLSAAIGASLSLDFEIFGDVETSDSVVVEISSNGGTDWSTLETFNGFEVPTTGSRSYDIGAFATADTQIRLRIDGAYGAADEFFAIDNVTISYGTADNTGGSTAFSAATASSSIIVTPVDAAPVFVDDGPFAVDEHAAFGTAVGDVNANDGDGADPGPGDLVFTEVMYNPASVEWDWEWVELYNGGSEVVDLSGFVLDDNNALPVSGANIASGSISPGETAVLYNADYVSAADFSAAWGAGLNLVAVTDWDELLLANAGDQISLWSSFADYSGDNVTHANPLLTLSYDNSAPWPVPDGAGSIFLSVLNGDPTDPDNWALSTPGKASPLGGTAYQSTAAGGNSGTDVGTPGDGPIAAGVTYSIVTNPNLDADGNGAFSIDAGTGVLTVNDPDDLDADAAASLNVTVRADDGANQTDTIVTVNLNPLNDNDPVADDESFSVAEGGTATGADLDAGTSLLDGDTDADLPNDTLTVNTTPVSGPSHGSLTLNANGTFSYTHDGSENFSDSFTYELLDADGGVSDTGTVTITVTPVNDNDPVADGGGPYLIDEGSGVTLDGSGSSDIDGTVVTYEWDILNDGSFEKTGSGATYSWADLVAAGPDNEGTYDVALRVTDDGGRTATQVFQLTVANVAPTLSGANDLAGIDEDPVTNPGTSVADLLAGQVTDPGTADAAGIAVVAVDDSNGTWEYTTNGGTNWFAFGAVDIANARLLGAEAGNLVRFVPDADWNGTVSNGITFHAWDQSTGSNGAVADITNLVSVRDNFDTAGYSNDDGSAAWNGGWVEFADDGLAGSGNVQITGGELRLDSHDGPDDEMIVRAVDLSGATTATLNLDWRAVGALEVSDWAKIEISGNGGGSWSLLEEITFLTGPASASRSYDITTFATADTQIRFQIESQFREPDELVMFDNVEIVYDTGVGGGATAFSAAAASSSIVVAPVNDSDPVADDESFTVAEGGTATEADLDAGASLLDGDTDADLPNDTLTVNTTPVSGPSHGSLTLNANGTFSYTHDGSENFTDSFTYELQDADGGVTDTGTVTIMITPVNDNDPVADDESFSVAEGGTATEADLDAGASLLDGDTDTDLPNDALTVNTMPVSGPSHGTLTLNANGTFSYTHDGTENFTDSFTYEVLDADGGVTDTGSVTITITPVNDNDPVADDESFTVVEGGTATEADLDAGSSLLDGDTDADLPNDSLTVNTTPVSGPSHGSLTLNANGTFSYTHDGSENLTDSFTYEVFDADGGVSDTGTVTITITPVNDNDPVADDESFTVSEGGTATEADLDAGTSLLDGDTDADLPNDTLTVNTTPVSGPSHGSLTLNANGTFSYIHDGSENFTDAFTYELLDADGGVTDTGTVTITITPVNDNDPVADDESFTVAEGGTATEADLDAGASLLDGDTDADLPNDTLTINTTPVSGPSHGSLTLNANGTFSYTHDGSENFSDSFTYEVLDADGGVSDTGTVTITVTPVNDNDPVADDESFTVAEGATATEADLDAGASLLDGDTDADLPNDTLTVNTTPVSGPSHGSLTLNANGTFSYTHDGSENFSDSFTYEVLDADGGVTGTGTVTIAITPVNDNDPVADDESFTVAEGGIATEADLDAGTSLLDGDTDADLPNDTLTVNTTPGSGPSHGSLTLNANGTFSYTHDGSENFSDSFTYEVLDADGGIADTGTVTITITPVNDNDPVADDESFTVAEGGTATEADLDAGASLLDGDTDADLPNDTLTVNSTPVSGPSHGSLTLNVNGSFSYTHDGSENFTDSFTYEVVDADGGVTDTATVTITVTPVNDNAPDITSDGGGPTAAVSINENNYGVTNVDATDADGTIPTYGLGGGVDDSFFTIDPVTGALRFSTAPDFETVADDDGDNVYEVIVEARDGVNTTQQAISVTVNDILNESGPLIDDATVSVAEDAADSTPVFDVNDANTGNDTDVDSEALTYSITGGNADGIFAVDPATGVITVDDNTSLDYESTQQYLLTVEATDGTNADIATITVDILPVNEAPVLSGAASNPTATESGTGTNAVALVQPGSVTVTDVDAVDFDGGSITVTLDAYRPGDLLSLAGAPAGVAATAGGSGTALTVTLNAGATPANVDTIIEAIRYENTGDDPTVGGADAARGYTITLNDGGNSPGPALTSNALAGTITLVGENEAPTFTNLSGGQVATTIGNSEAVVTLANLLTLGDEADSDGSVTGFVVQSVLNGSLRIGTSAATATAFVAGVNDTIDSSNNAYWETAPSVTGLIDVFDLTAQDNDGAESAGTVTARVDVLPPAGPSLGANSLTINEGGMVTLGAGDLAASDPDTLDATLQFSVSNVENGRFERIGAAGTAITTFLQSEITAGDIRFVHDGGEDAPSYDVTVSDGLSDDGPITAIINFGNVNDAPDLGNNALTVIDGVPVTLSFGSDLSAFDPDTANAALTFTVSKVVNGQFELSSAPGVAITSFTQADLAAGIVQFVPDGEGEAPGYEVEVFDGAASDGPIAAIVTFTPPLPGGEPPPDGSPKPDVTPGPISPPPKPDPIDDGGSDPADPPPDNETDDTEDEESTASGPVPDTGSKATPVIPPLPEEPEAVRDIDAGAGSAGVHPLQALLSGLASGGEALDALLGGIAANAEVSYEALTAMLEQSGLLSRLNGMRDDIESDLTLEKTIVGSSVAVSTGLSVGYVVWLVRGGALLSSVLSSLPAWRMIDPLPVLAALRSGEDEGDDDSLEAMVKASGEAADKQEEPPGTAGNPAGEAASEKVTD